MIHDKRDIQGKITVTLEAEDWVWMCELLAEIANLPETELDVIVKQDFEHALAALEAFEDGR